MLKKLTSCALAALTVCSIHTICTVKNIRTIEQFEQLKKKGCPSVVNFFTPWCQACKMIGKAFHNVANDSRFSHINFITVNADNAIELTNEKKIKEVPTFLFIADGKIKSRIVGVEKPDDFEEFLTKKIIKKLPVKKRIRYEGIKNKITNFFNTAFSWAWSISKKSMYATKKLLGL